ncbi:MAG: class I SAM-dependent methyltransferase [Candidatus Eisenbacteria bacterium]|nr:class I SAM-dependent methyltransferase [Candidatus Eisenbacteria bacterium]
MLERPHHELLYSYPKYFDVAFGYRDLSAECGFLEHLSRHLGRGVLESFMEVCCGPGYHMHHFAARGVRSYGVEYSDDMVPYARDKAYRLALAAGFSGVMGASPEGRAIPPISMVLQGDPREVSLPEAVDLAFMPWLKLGYLLTDEEVIEHFVTVAKNIGRGGLYVLELDHPAHLFGYPERSERQWDASENGVRVSVHWGDDHELIDPITHTTEVEVAFDVEDGARKESIQDEAPMRSFTHRELRALVRLSGVFDWVATFGDLSVTQPFDLSPGARRMVPVLRCNI